jgi:hypothetical protein
MSRPRVAAFRPATAVDIRPATAKNADGIAELYHDVYKGAYPIAESTDPALIRRTLVVGRHVWFIALHEGTVVGSVQARPDPTGEAYEICGAAVRGAALGLGASLVDVSTQTAMERPDCQLVYGYARSELSRHVFSRTRHTVSWVGTDGAMHPVGAEREEHLVGVLFNPERRVIRIIPAASVLQPRSEVAQAVAATRSWTRPGAYPARIAGGSPGELTHESAAGRVTYSIFEPSRAAIVGAIDADSPADARRVLWEAVDNAPGRIEHVTVQVLADKIRVMEQLSRVTPGDPTRRFATRAYLPGWHKEGDARYDCVTMTALLDPRQPKRLGFADRVDAIYRSFPLAFR